MSQWWPLPACILLLVLVFVANARWQEAQNKAMADYAAVLDSLYTLRHAWMLSVDREKLRDSLYTLRPVCVHPDDEVFWYLPKEE